METFTTCTTCAVVIVNGDDSVWEDMTPDERASADAALEAMGWVSAQQIDFGGYFTCFVCDEVSLGERSVFESTTV